MVDKVEDSKLSKLIYKFTQKYWLFRRNNQDQITVSLEDLNYLTKFAKKYVKPYYGWMGEGDLLIRLTKEEYEELKPMSISKTRLQTYRDRHKERVNKILENLSDDDHKIKKLIKYV